MHTQNNNVCFIYLSLYALCIYVGVAKLRRCLNGYDLPTDHGIDRVKFVCGDLEQKKFGLDHQAFKQLGRSVSQIYHFGAHVNHVLGYNALRYKQIYLTMSPQ